MSFEDYLQSRAREHDIRWKRVIKKLTDKQDKNLTEKLLLQFMNEFIGNGISSIEDAKTKAWYVLELLLMEIGGSDEN